MIITYGWLDQYKQIGVNTYPDWFGEIEFIIPVTPASRTVIIYDENRTVVITQENRTVVIAQ